MKDKFNRLFRNINPAVLIIVGVLLVNNLISSNQTPSKWLMNQILLLPGIIVGLTFHEAAHGYVSYWLGDPTPKNQGRLSLNPMRHIDPIGFLALFAGFGWGQPVQINPAYYKHRRRDELLVALAGVVTNFIIAVLSAGAIRLLISNTGFMFNDLEEIIFLMLYYMMTVNVMLMIFNLLPVPPLDGFGVATELFNLRKYDWYYPVYKNGFYILMILIIFNITDKIITPLMTVVIDFLL